MKTKKSDGKKVKYWEFSHIAKKIADLLGSFWSFLAALLLCLLWLISGPFFNYSDTWQLVINTSTTVITFLMVFVIQNTQNRDTTIVNLKLDEIIKSIKSADNKKLEIDELSEDDLKELLEKYKKLKNKKTGG